MEPFIGEIRMMGFNFAPRGWAFCAGQILPIQQNTALFSLLGTTYGGNGQTTFALPDLRGISPNGYDQGAGLTPYALGETGGSATVTLQSSELPAHTHALAGVAAVGNKNDPAAAGRLAQSSIRSELYGASANTTMAANAILPSGGSGQAHNNMPPYLAVNFCIALEGVFPARN